MEFRAEQTQNRTPKARTMRFRVCSRAGGASATLVAAWVMALTCGLVACGGSPSQPPAAGLDVNVTIANGQVTPTNATLQAKVGKPITFHVTSDPTDELHVHSLATVKVACVVTGHIVAVVAAHDRALRLLPAGHQLTGQLTMMLVMVGYTFTGLYLLFGG
jgi:hypothetical protein